MTLEKQKSLVKLLCGFPSMASLSEDQMQAMLASYLETLSDFSSREVSNACDRIRKRGNAFPPSAGEVYAECEKSQPDTSFSERWERLIDETPRLAKGVPLIGAPPRREFTLEQLADWNCLVNAPGKLPYTMRADAKGNPLPIPEGHPGAGHEAAYGYLTPAEMRAWRSRTGLQPMAEAAE